MYNLQNATKQDVVCLARTLLREDLEKPPVEGVVLGNENDESFRAYLGVAMSGYDVEHLDAFYFSADGRMVNHVNISKGTEREVSAPHREIARQGLLCNATYVAVAHNHPNGDPTVSEPDKTFAAACAKTMETVDLIFINAYVVAGPSPDKVVRVPPPQPTRASLQDLFDRIL